MIYVLDTSAMIAFLRNEPGMNEVRLLLRDPGNTCHAHAVNLCEVYYDFIRAVDESAAQAAIQDLAWARVLLREDMDAAFWQDVARTKAPHRISLADCFCIALARRLNGELVTSDHQDFDPIVPLGLCPVRFIR